MRKFLSILVIAVFFLSPLGVAQEEIKADKTTEAEQDKVLSTLETAKNGQVDIEKTPEQLAKEKEALEAKKAKLAGDIPPEKIEDPDIKKQLKALEKEQQVIEAKELAIQERIEATERAISVFEKKINVINKEDLTFSELNYEFKQIRKSLRSDEKEKALLKTKIPLITIEIDAIEKEIAAHKMLLDLKQEDKDSIRHSIQESEERLEGAQTELALINERMAFIDVQIETERNYLKVVVEKRFHLLKNQLFSRKAYSYDPFDFILLLILLLCLLFISVIRRKVASDSDTKEHLPHHPRVFISVLRKIVLITAIYSAAYFIVSFTGYHAFAIFFTYRIFIIGLLYFIFRGLYRSMKIAFGRIVSRGEEGSKERIMMKASLEILSTVMAWGFFLLGVFLVVEILGIRYEVAELLVDAAKKPFFTLGSVNLSVWLILKALIILWVFIAGANILDSLLRKNVYKRMHLEESVQYTFSVTLKYLMLIIGALIGLAALGVELAALTVFAGTIGIGIGFGLQDIAKNFISGIVMLVERPVKIGDYIEVSGLPGKVRAIKARSTIVDTFDNISVIVPNAEFMNQQVVNWSYSDKITRVKISVGVAYGSDTELVKESLLEVAKTHGKVLHNPEPYVWFEEFGDSSLNFRLFVWTNEPQSRFTLKSDLHYMIDKIFRERGITIAFPQRDIHFKSSNVPLK